MTNLVKRNNSLNNLFEKLSEESWLNPRYIFSLPNWFSENFMFDFFDENEATNIYETSTEYIIEYNKAGMPEKNWNIEIKNNYIFVKAENIIENEERDTETKYYKKTYQNIKIDESYLIPKNVNTEKIKALYKDGILKIILPKNIEEPSEIIPKKINVES
jgi:HSP20 family protein